MREIKFRAWNPKTKVLHSWETIVTKWDNEEFTGLFLIPQDKFYKLMQYTGLKDKNGKEIYEGDIIVYLVIKYKSVVEWEHGGFGFIGADGEPMYTEEDFEVIGNIYENPELLKKGLPNE